MYNLKLNTQHRTIINCNLFSKIMFEKMLQFLVLILILQKRNILNLSVQLIDTKNTDTYILHILG